ncbi:MAG: TraR/DksA family transcriptional regulator [Bacteriovoracales bacterium]|nr:TraR/DksA family transcriptional regulator [Bacteriovoracales bacterium]
MEAYGHGLTQGQLDVCKELLDRDKERILNSMEEKTGQINFQQSESKDSVDEANENIMLSHTTRLTNRENLYLKKILNSIQKVEEGTYGQCEDCGGTIPYERLKARPTSDLCIVCKEESEGQENQSVFGRRSKSLGQTLTVSGNRL